MSRLIFVPQFPSKMRYQETWYEEFPKQMKKYFDEVIVLGETYISATKDTKSKKDMFSPIHQAIVLESEQINDFYNMKLYDDDILWVSDLSFPGFFCNALHHKRTKNMFCFVHGTSKNHLDYFEPVRESKWLVETGHSKLFNKIFVATEYHKKKLGWNNTRVVGISIPPYQSYSEKKEYEIISVVRSNSQKITKSIEDRVEKDHSKIVRKDVNSWEEYYKFLSSAKILLITTKEETFGYSSLEAIMNGTIVLAPNKFSYPELLPREFLYNNYDELSLKIWSSLNGDLRAPEKLICHDMCENFYENIAKEMKN